MLRGQNVKEKRRAADFQGLEKSMPPQINGEKSHVRNAKKSSPPIPLAAPFSKTKKTQAPPTQINGEKSHAPFRNSKVKAPHSTSRTIFSLNWPPPLRKKRRKFLLV